MKYNGFNNGKDASDGVGGRPPYGLEGYGKLIDIPDAHYGLPPKENIDMHQITKLKTACETVVNGYEGDGMEGMKDRDIVAYNTCKDALKDIS